MDENKLQSLKGFRDFLPPEQRQRQQVFSDIRKSFEKFGFLPMSTPVMEYKEILMGKYGEEGDKLMYSFTDLGDREVALRYDLTVPLARFIATNRNELSFPFKRYQIDPVWRADKPQKGRFREFYQCDIDVVGTDSLLADAETIACLDQTLEDLGVTDRVIRINNRQLLEAIVQKAGIFEKDTADVVRILDKLEKQGEKQIRGELASLGVQTAQADKLFEFFKLNLDSPAEIIEELEGIDGAGQFAQMVEFLLDMGVENYQVDLTLARGMDYYTGTIFEIIIPDAAQYGSIAGGGRYDGLLGRFTNEDIPAVGGSIGIDRLLEALEELELIDYDLAFDVMVCNLDQELLATYMKTVSNLREAGIKTDFYYNADKLEKQFKYADSNNIDYVVIVGPDEIKNGEVQVKNMKTGTQEAVAETELEKYLLGKLNI